MKGARRVNAEKPPGDGWVPFGTNVDQGVPLEFAILGGGGIPQWEREAHMVTVREDTYRRYAAAFALLQDLDRCVHGRHSVDECIDCAKRRRTDAPDDVCRLSLGNPHLRPGVVMGYGSRGKRIVPPDPSTTDFFEPAKWYRA